MNFAYQVNTAPKFSGIMIAVALHLVLGYALLTGLARKVVQVMNAPIDVSLIEESRYVPPPKVTLLPMPKAVTVPPVYVPPPNVTVLAPQQNTIATDTTPQPPAENVAGETRIAVPASPPLAAVGITCPNHVEVRSRVAFPVQAQRMGLSGDVVVEFTVGESGQLSNIGIARSSNPVFNDAAITAVSQLHCKGSDRDVRVRVPFAFRLEH